MNIKDVVIVGGGLSGWMTAAALSKLCKNVNVKLIESPTIPIVEIGDSSVYNIRRFFYTLGIDDKDWMPSCNATYKNSNRFTNFRKNDNSSFECPFVYDLDYTDKPSGINSWSELTMFFPKEFQPHTFAEFFAISNTLLSKYNKQTYNYDDKLKVFDFKWDTAFQFDPKSLSNWLRDNIAKPNGVEYIIANPKSPIHDETGYLSEIVLDDGTTIKADLFVDCTGFHSVLLEKWMGSTHIDFHDHLATDSIIMTEIPYVDREKEISNVTEYIALKNGWAWKTYLWDRIKIGYCYSSRFTDDESAEKELRDYFLVDSSIEHIKFRHGYHTKAWIKNVVAIGKSHGFVEPLAAIDLMSTHDNLLKLVDTINRRDGYVSRMEREGFNFSCGNDIIKYRDFISMYYSLSERTDTPFWEWCTQENEYCKEQFSPYYLIRNQYPVILDMINTARKYPYNFNINLFIVAGMGVRSISTPELLFFNDFKNSKLSNAKIEEMKYTRDKYVVYKEAVEKYIQTLPSNYEFLKEHIYGGVDEYSEG